MDSVSLNIISDSASAVCREISIQEVIDVENTVSPKMLRGAPNDLPVKDWPLLR